ncbi:MAG TPA: hypothetical protein VGS80_26280 [Ktedonobacterales bacterium]|nr:hypothetical protein [Ktedonobacterales bacterium]
MTWYDQSLDWEHPQEAIPWSQEACDRFNAAMLEVLAAIRQELGEEYTLVNEQPAMQAHPVMPN